MLSQPPVAPSPLRPRATKTTEPAPPPPKLTRKKKLRRLRLVLLVLMAALVPIGWSYAGYLTAPGGAPTSVRTVDWFRDHGFESPVNRVEQWWYTRSKPTGQQAPNSDLPSSVRSGSAATDGAISPIVRPTQTGEGLWRPVKGLAVPSAGIQQTFLRPDPAHPSVAANIVRLDQRATKLVLVPGTKEPGGSGWAWRSSIPRSERSSAVAAFNAGFRFRHTLGGIYTEGRHAVRPLENGVASIVIHRNGVADIAKWGRDASMTSDVVSVRQNLALIVDGGRAVDGLVTDRANQWGSRKSQLQYTWRSGVGVDAQGRLLYLAGRQMSLSELAQALAKAGALRGMQLDIHDNTVSFNWFRPNPSSPGTPGVEKLMPSMQRSASRYLTADQRDFLAVMAR